MLQRTLFLTVIIYFFVCASLFLGRLALDTNDSFECVHALMLLQQKDFAEFPESLMTMPYEGHLAAYLLVPLFAIFGPSVFTGRFIYVMFSFFSLISIFYVCKRWFNRSVALVVIFLLGINTNFIRCTRIGSSRDEILQISLV